MPTIAPEPRAPSSSAFALVVDEHQGEAVADCSHEFGHRLGHSASVLLGVGRKGRPVGEGVDHEQHGRLAFSDGHRGVDEAAPARPRPGGLAVEQPDLAG
jgi:hypothetical protein